MTAIWAIATSDWRVRTQSAGFVLLLAIVLQAGYWFVPESRYTTVDFDGHRGIYNSAWMGIMMSLLGGVVIWLFGVFLVRGALLRELRFGFSDLVAASPISRFGFVVGKWLSNLAVLATIAAALFVAGVAMQLIRGESRALDFTQYAAPFVALVLPVCALVAAVAILFDTVRPLRGALGGVVWFVFANVAMAMTITHANGFHMPMALDPLGISVTMSSIIPQLLAQYPHAHANDFALGASLLHGPVQTFTFTGISWTPQAVAQRLGWTMLALPVLALATVAFDRFRTGSLRASARPAGPRVCARLLAALPDVPGTRLVRVELGVLLGDANVAWVIVYVALAVAGFALPAQALEIAILPAALIWPLGRYAVVGTADRLTRVETLVLAAPSSSVRTVLARIVAAGIVVAIPLLGIIVRQPSLVAAPFALAALALALGSLSGTPRLFEALFIIFWYAGINSVPATELWLDATRFPRATPVISALIVAGAGAIAFAAAKARYRRY